MEIVFVRSFWDWIGLYRVRRVGVGSDLGKEGFGGVVGYLGGIIGFCRV